jgi:hypothetical protein
MRMPDMKNSAPHTIRINSVWPKSGSSTSSATTTSSAPSASEVAGISGRRVDSENSQATSTTKAGFANSDAWMLMPAIEIQRREPLTSAPNTSVAASSTTLIANMISAERRTCRGEKNETPIITANAGRMNSTCRLKK